MRVTVVGASGNAGSALLRALAREPWVTHVHGVARRVPSDEVARLATSWQTLDVGARGPWGDDRMVQAQLTEALAGSDAVVHLAWQIQPNRERDRLRATNVEGTRRVLAAAARAGVGQVVVASSVGAYSPVADDVLRDESHATGGTRTSHYAVDKAAQEALLRSFVATHPGIDTAWLRPALIFQRHAGAEIVRYFLGHDVLRAVLAPHAVPVLPWPRGFRLQAVHADDVAQAYVAALRSRAQGPFNVAAPDVLDGQAVADVLGSFAACPVPRGLARPAVALAWRSRLVATDPGWFDMGAGVPLMSTGRARSELGWEPTWSARDALAEVVAGMRAGSGLGEHGPLRAADRLRAPVS